MKKSLGRSRRPAVGKVLFVSLAMDDADFEISEKTEYKLKRLPQLGFQYLSAVLKKERNTESVIWDQAIEYFTPEDLSGELSTADYGFVGFYSATAIKEKLKYFIKRLCENECPIPIVVGGPGALSAEDYLAAGCDIVCHGEAEITVCEIMDFLEGARPPEHIKGISFRKDNTTVHTSPRELIGNLDGLPFPDRTHFPLHNYYDFRIFNMRQPYTTMVTSRGCAHRCSFCSSWNHWGGKLRLRSPHNVISEIEQITNDYGVKYIGFKDDMFAGSDSWAADFCNMLIDRKYGLRWSCMLYPLTLQKDLEKKMDLFRRAGCDFISLGLQSVDPGILIRAGRDIREPAMVERIVREAKKRDISVMSEFIVGLPGESEESIKSAMRYALKTRPHYVQFYSLSVLEGSKLSQEPREPAAPCSMDTAQMRRWCVKSMRGFYSRPGIIIQNVLHILRKRPAWFLVGIRFLPYFFKATGMGRIAHHRPHPETARTAKAGGSSVEK